MAFNGVELLEVTPPTKQLVMYGGGHVLSVGVWTSTASTNAQLSVMDASSGESLLYNTSTLITYSSEIYSNWDYQETLGEFFYDSYRSGLFRCRSDGYSANMTNTMQVFPSCLVATPNEVLIGRQSGQTGEGNGWTFFYRINLTTGILSTHTVAGNALGRYGSRVFVVDGTSLREIDPSNPATTIASLGNLPASARLRATREGDWLWWKSTSTSAELVGYNPVTNERRALAATPAGMPTSFLWSTWTIHDGVAYRINADKQSVLAVDLSNARWKSDNLPTTRGGRWGIGVANGKLWIPSTVTPP